jgi:hypothetical protein
VSLKDAQLPDYVICPRGVYAAMSANERSRFSLAMASNPTSLDSGGRILLLKLASHAPAPRPPDTGTQETLYRF